MKKRKNQILLVVTFLVPIGCKTPANQTSEVQSRKTKASDFDNVKLIPPTTDFLISQEAQIDSKFEQYEVSEAHERKVNSILVDLSTQMLDKARHGNPHGKASRDAHAKSHGCLRAWVDIDNRSLPAYQRVGFFAKNATYKSYVRFSNNDHLPIRKDGERDLRGMAFKVFGVNYGEQILKNSEGNTTIDFLMYGHKKFFIKNNEDYIGFIEGIRDGEGKKRLLWEQTTGAIKTVQAQKSIFDKKNPLAISYFSATPVRLGHRDDQKRSAMKYGVEPCNNYTGSDNSTDTDFNYMRDNLIRSLKTYKEVCFKFKIQPQTYPEVMPIEDATELWPDERGSIVSGISGREKFQPYLDVGKITIKYEENSDLAENYDMTELCEDMSMTPWRTISEHKPLGRTMRMRRDLYDGTSKFRRSANKVKFTEPEAWTLPVK
jgi:hypothetical protein